MKAKRVEPKQEFIPVIVTLESQEEVDALYAVIDNTVIVSAIPILNRWQLRLQPFKSPDYRLSFVKLDGMLR